MCSELTPRAPVPDNRIPQLMQPWSRRKASNYYEIGGLALLHIIPSGIAYNVFVASRSLLLVLNQILDNLNAGRLIFTITKPFITMPKPSWRRLYCASCLYCVLCILYCVLCIVYHGVYYVLCMCVCVYCVSWCVGPLPNEADSRHNSQQSSPPTKENIWYIMIIDKYFPIVFPYKTALSSYKREYMIYDYNWYVLHSSLPQQTLFPSYKREYIIWWGVFGHFHCNHELISSTVQTKYLRKIVSGRNAAGGRRNHH